MFEFVPNFSYPLGTDPVKKLTLASSNLAQTLNYWHGLLGLTIVEEKENRATLACAPSQMQLEFVDIGMLKICIYIYILLVEAGLLNSENSAKY